MITPRTRTSRRLLLLKALSALLLVALIFGIIVTIMFKLSQPKQEQNSTPTDAKASSTVTPQSVGLPLRLTIPAINIDAAIGYAGVAADGTMEISQSQDDVAWFEPGTRPGDKGSAVIAGHYGSVNGKYSVFSNLSKLKQGDTLQIRDHKNNTATFIVRESRIYDPKADATDVFNSNDDKAHLNLITCEGSWNNAAETYSKRRVIFADRAIN